MKNSYISPFRIIGTSVKSLKIKNDLVAINDGPNTKRKLVVSHSIKVTNDPTNYTGTVLLNIKATTTEQKAKYVIELLIEGCFMAPKEIEEDEFRSLLRINGITSLYSIARGFVQSATSQTLMVGSILLPMFNVAAYSKDMDAQETVTT